MIRKRSGLSCILRRKKKLNLLPDVLLPRTGAPLCVALHWKVIYSPLCSKQLTMSDSSTRYCSTEVFDNGLLILQTDKIWNSILLHAGFFVAIRHQFFARKSKHGCCLRTSEINYVHLFHLSFFRNLLAQCFNLNSSGAIPSMQTSLFCSRTKSIVRRSFAAKRFLPFPLIALNTRYIPEDGESESERSSVAFAFSTPASVFDNKIDLSP